MTLLSNFSLLGEEEIRNNRDESDRRKIEIFIIQETNMCATGSLFDSTKYEGI